MACNSTCNSCDGNCVGRCYSGNTCSKCDSGACNNNCNSCNSCNSGCDASCNARCYNCQVCYSGCNLDQSCSSCNICDSSCHDWFDSKYNKTKCQGYNTTEEHLLCYDQLPKDWTLCHNQDKKGENCGSNAYGCISNSPIYCSNYECNNA